MIINEKRALAYSQKISWVKPIDGADNIELVGVLGWTCIAKKGEFQPGDMTIYFEIDSKLPVAEWSEFMEPRHYKVKTMKLSKFNVISQGLALPYSAFEQSIRINLPLNENVDVTDLLKVTYAVEEDNKRKANVDSNAKYTSMKARHKKFFSNKFVKKLMKYMWFRKFIFVFLGKKKDSPKAFPTGFPYVHKTDEERCLPANTKILTDSGWITIGKIVNNKLNVKVASMNKDKTISFKKILDYQKFNNDKQMVTIKYPYKPGVKRQNALCCTEDHKCFTDRGYVEAKDVTISDKLYMPFECYSEDALPAIYGMLLGDSHINIDRRTNGMLRIAATNGENQKDYLEYKKSIYNNDGKISISGIGSFSTLPCYRWFMTVDPCINEFVKNDWVSDGHKKISDNVINKLNDISLAFWYMDDGCVSYRNDEKTAYFIRLNTQGFSFEENEKLCSMLKRKFNISAKVNKDKIAKDGHQMYRVDISSTSECDKFFTLVSPYVCDSMLYKLPPKWANRELVKLHYEKSLRVFPVQVLSVEKGQTKNKYWKKTFNTVYDIEVEDNHNFIADNVVVHNCENMPFVLGYKNPLIVTEKLDGTSCTYILERQKFGKYEFYVSSRNVRQLNPNQECYHEKNIYWELASKYDIENKLKKYLEDNKDLKYVCIQGEGVGAVQGNPLKLKEDDLYIFNFIRSDIGRLSSVDGKAIIEEFGMKWVPILDENFMVPEDMEEFKLMADAKSVVNPNVMREGIVLRDPKTDLSFKNVSRQYLLKHNG